MDSYKKMVLIRVLEQRLQQLCDAGQGADLHFSKGQEAIAVGVCAALRSTDYLVTHHRTIAHAVAKGVPLEPLIAEVLGLPGGLSKGRAGEMHLSYPPARFMFSFQLVGTCVPVAAGLAWAVKNYKKSDDIVVCFHGDAATANGQWHEGMNLAAVQRVPLLLICEDNGLAGNVRPEHYQPRNITGVAARADGYGVLNRLVDGNDVQWVHQAAGEAAEVVRKLQRPFLLECITTRLSRHKQGQGDIRTKEELAELALRDPLLQEAQRLGLSQGQVKSTRLQAKQQVQAVLTAVRGVTP
ncbi:MAG: thiamine pyrophosphate-dependent dehydrogenase E1 component subunit alpha [Pseudomonadota bacterium]|nr:thiamine pyrophosphate-dependent dehydrogenase E1 component subunit alpha [Pseudomonadota bacterium]